MINLIRLLRDLWRLFLAALDSKFNRRQFSLPHISLSPPYTLLVLFFKYNLFYNKYISFLAFFNATSTGLMRWLQLRFDFDSTAVRRPFDCLSNVVKDTVM